MQIIFQSQVNQANIEIWERRVRSSQHGPEMSLSLLEDIVLDKSTVIKKNKEKIKAFTDEKSERTPFYFQEKLMIFYSVYIFCEHQTFNQCKCINGIRHISQCEIIANAM